MADALYHPSAWKHKALMLLVKEQPKVPSQKVFISAFVETDLNSLLKVCTCWYWFSIAASPNCSMAVIVSLIYGHIHMCLCVFTHSVFLLNLQNRYTFIKFYILYYYDPLSIRNLFFFLIYLLTCALLSLANRYSNVMVTSYKFCPCLVIKSCLTAELLQ